MIDIKGEEKSISRVLRSHKEAKRSYDRMSLWYDWIPDSGEKKFINLGLEKLKDHKDERLLEIGFGTGLGLVELARSLKLSGRILGIDISEGMGRKAFKRLKKAGLENQVHLICGDGMELPFQKEAFNSVFMSFTLELFDTPEIHCVLQECRRVLSDRGRLCVVSLSRAGTLSRAVKIYEWIHQKIPKYVDCRPIYVREALEHENFSILNREVKTMWGLPVEIVFARKTSPGISG